MVDIQSKALRRKQLSYAISLALASLMAGNCAQAQTGTPAQDPAPDGEIAQVLVVGARASQQSAIERKKNAATAQDSIVAEDVGAFPDRNIAEAVSRISGIALDRGDFGEGVNVTVRGNGADLTRVEIDGMGVQAGGGTDLNGGGGGRGVELRELSSDLIKSVDIVKGSTADMTEGSLGGGIIIKTRTGLDFKKRFISARVSAAQNSLNKEISPDLNLVFADKFLDSRLGVLLNVTKSRAHNEAHSIQNSTSASAGYFRLLDFDQSPEKTFSFNPALVSRVDQNAARPMLQSALTAGGTFDSLSPLEIVTRSGAANTKADCYTAFPALSAAQQSAITSGNVRNGAINQRSNELLTCLNQWNDYTPSLVRYSVKRQDDDRIGGDVRLDFKVDSKLSVYAKVNKSSREVIDNFLTFNMGGLNVNPVNVQLPNGYFGPAYSETGGTRVPTAAGGYSLFNNASFRANAYPIQGAVANVVPGSYTVDPNHRVTRFSVSDANVNSDQIYQVIETGSQYLQAGGTYKDGGLKIEFLLGDAKSDFTRSNQRSNFSYNYGAANLSVAPNGVWLYDFPASSGFDQANAAMYSTPRATTAPRPAVAASPNGPAAPAYTVAQLPLSTASSNIDWQPKAGESREKTAKLDLSYAFKEGIPFFQTFKTGFNLRDNSGTSWGNGGLTIQAQKGTFGTAGYVAPIILPNARVTTAVSGCQDTPGSLGAGGLPCKFGYTPNTNLATSLAGQSVLTVPQFQDMVGQGLAESAWSRFFDGAKDRPASLTDGWNRLDVPRVAAIAGTRNMDFNCLYECVANDGKTYKQPYSSYREKTSAGYLMTEFELTELPFLNRALPFGMELSGNFGYRYVRTAVQGSGYMQFASVTKTAAYNPQFPSLPTGFETSTFSREVALEKTTTDWMPVFNAALWVMPDEVVVRYNRAKTIARPGVSNLMPSGSCTFDSRYGDFVTTGGEELDQQCSGVIGNPALKPRTNINQNLSLEWYLNKDTMFTAAVYKQKGIIGGPVRVARSDNLLFAGSNAVDPISGVKLSEFDFNYSTYENAPAFTRRGFEVGSKVAFTFLPSVLRHTGLDLNYTKARSNVTEGPVRDLLTGEALPPAGESRYSYNASLWYDDGSFTARIALQTVSENFICIASCFNANAVNNFPAEGAGGRINVLPFNPGSPNFKATTRFIDAKVAYRFENGLELFAEARNLGKAGNAQTQAHFVPFADGTPNLNDLAYPGRRIMVGLTVRH